MFLTERGVCCIFLRGLKVKSAVEDSISSVENVPVKIEVFDDDNDSFEGNVKVTKAGMIPF